MNGKDPREELLDYQEDGHQTARRLIRTIAFIWAPFSLLLCLAVLAMAVSKVLNDPVADLDGMTTGCMIAISTLALWATIRLYKLKADGVYVAFVFLGFCTMNQLLHFYQMGMDYYRFKGGNYTFILGQPSWPMVEAVTVTAIVTTVLVAQMLVLSKSSVRDLLKLERRWMMVTAGAGATMAFTMYFV